MNILLKTVSIGKCLSINVRKAVATFVATSMLKRGGGGGGGGVNQVIMRFLVLFFSLFLLLHVTSNCRLVLNPLGLLCMGRGGGGVALLNI